MKRGAHLLLLLVTACAAEPDVFVAGSKVEAARGNDPFDVIVNDHNRDGAVDVLVNWHHHDHLELLINHGQQLTPVSPPLADAVTATDLVADGPPQGDVKPAIYVWHEHDRAGPWHIYALPPPQLAAGARLRVSSDGHIELAKGPRRTQQVRIDGRTVELIMTGELLHAKITPGGIAQRLRIQLINGADTKWATRVGAERSVVADGVWLGKPDPHGFAWSDVTGAPTADLFGTRGALQGLLRPPLPGKTDPVFVDGVRTALLPADFRRGRRVAWVDIDRDGVNELHVTTVTGGHRLLRRRGETVFEDTAVLDDARGDVAAWLDVDGDGDDDLITREAVRGFEWHQNNDGTFTRTPGEDIGLRVRGDRAGLFSFSALHVLDLEPDGDLDLWLAPHGSKGSHLLFERDGTTFQNVTAAWGLANELSTQLLVGDIDADGDMDAVSVAATPTLLTNTGRRFERHKITAAGNIGWHALGALADLDGDRDLDLWLVTKSRRLRMENRSPNALTLAVDGSERNVPFGALVTAHFKDGRVLRQRFGSHSATAFSQSAAPLYVGGPITRLQVRWPDGATKTIDSPAPGVLDIKRAAPIVERK